MKNNRQVNSFDVIVAGGGSAGSVAAVAAARNGARTLLVEEYGFLGGSATAALVTPFMGNRAGGVNLNQGLTSEIKTRLKEVGGGGTGPDDNDGWFNPEALKYVLEDMALEAGVTLLYHTRIIDVLVRNCRVEGVIIHNKAGIRELRAGVVIDATGDGDVAVQAGVPYESGRPEDGKNQALSLRFLLGNVNLERLALFLGTLDEKDYDPRYLHSAMVWKQGWRLEPLFREAVADGVLEETDGDYFQFFTVPGRPGELAFNCPRLGERVNGIDPWDLTHAQIEGRKAIRRLVEFCRRYLPGCEEAYLVLTAPMVGVRESRRIVGDYVLSLEDIKAARKFPDAVARNRYPVDIHLPKSGAGEGDGVGCEYFHLEPDVYYEVPYRCLLPRGVENLLVAGRNISATFVAQSSLRIQPNCHSLGQAAGTAAALAVKRGITPRELDGRELRAILKDQGACL